MMALTPVVLLLSSAQHESGRGSNNSNDRCHRCCHCQGCRSGRVMESTMTIRDAAILGLGWHAAMVMLIDGITREDYHDLVALLRNVPECPGRSRDDIRDALKPFARRRTSPFGVAFALWWSAHRSRQRSGGRRYLSNSRVDLFGSAGWIAGIVILGLTLCGTAVSAASLPQYRWGDLLGVFGWANLAGLALLPAARIAIRRQASIGLATVLLVLVLEAGGAAAGGVIAFFVARVVGWRRNCSHAGNETT